MNAVRFFPGRSMICRVSELLKSVCGQISGDWLQFDSNTSFVCLSNGSYGTQRNWVERNWIGPNWVERNLERTWANLGRMWSVRVGTHSHTRSHRFKSSPKKA